MKEIVDENTEWEEERDDLGHVICYTKVTTTEEITDNVPSKRVTKIPYRISPTDGIREITSIRYEDRTTGENAKIGPHHETWTSLEKYHKDRKIVPQGKEQRFFACRDSNPKEADSQATLTLLSNKMH